MKNIKNFCLVILIFFLILLAHDSQASDQGICTLSSDTCNSLINSTACSKNKKCFMYEYMSLTNKVYICAGYNNSCLKYKDYQKCQANKNCTWKGNISKVEPAVTGVALKFCTLASDSCNSLSQTACEGNSLCALSYYTNLGGSNVPVCFTAGNICLAKSYSNCLLFTSCRWYGLSEQLPVGSSVQSTPDSGPQETFSATTFPGLDNPLVSSKSPQVLIGKVINVIMGAVGSLALIMFIFGGISWMTASGNEEKVKKSIEIIVWSTIGLAVIFLSYALVKLLIANAV